LANAFYAIEVEGLEYIPPDGCSTILCPNHANSLTDPICLLAAIPKDKRDMVIVYNSNDCQRYILA
ncbi:14330_t:CDS:2, partial [Racocetra persica]